MEDFTGGEFLFICFSFGTNKQKKPPQETSYKRVRSKYYFFFNLYLVFANIK